MERNYMFIEYKYLSDIHDVHDFIIVVCAGQESSVIDFVNCQKCTY